MRRKLFISAIWGLISVLLTLVACGSQPGDSPAPGVVVVLLGTPVAISDQATLAFALAQEQNNADDQAVATAKIMRANAQATLDSANATLNAVRVQDQNNADALAAQIAAAAEIVRANAQATLVAAGSTQSAALTQDAIRQTQVQYDLQVAAASASTQTAAADLIATQTQSALATSQYYVDQSYRRQEQRQGPIGFVWMWCLPIFVLLLAGLVVWGFWRWLKIQQANQRILENPVDKLQAPPTEIIHYRQGDSAPYFESDVVDNRYRLTKPDDRVRRWLDEVKRKLLSSDKKDEDDNTNK
jgi:hypothetical protein